MATGILILSKGRYVKIGLAARVLFNLFLAQLVLGWPEIQRPGSDFRAIRGNCRRFEALTFVRSIKRQPE
jgi:hypothetical protein